jgi:hypothetical protein
MDVDADVDVGADRFAHGPDMLGGLTNGAIVGRVPRSKDAHL